MPHVILTAMYQKDDILPDKLPEHMLCKNTMSLPCTLSLPRLRHFQKDTLTCRRMHLIFHPANDNDSTVHSSSGMLRNEIIAADLDGVIGVNEGLVPFVHRSLYQYSIPPSTPLCLIRCARRFIRLPAVHVIDHSLLFLLPM